MKNGKRGEEQLYMLHDDRNHPDKGRTPEEIQRGLEEAEKRLANGRRERLLAKHRVK